MKLRTRLLLGYVLVFVLMIIVAMVSLQTNRTMLENQNWVKRSEETVSAAYKVQSNILGMQIAIRGYVLTGKPEELQRYEDRRQDYNAELVQLRAAVGNDPIQSRRVAEIESRVERWLGIAADEIEMRRKVTEGKARFEDLASMITGSPVILNLFKDIVERMNAVIAAERTTLESRIREAATATQHGTEAVIGGTALAIVLGIGVMLTITRKVLHQVGGEPVEIAAGTEQIALGNLDMAMDGRSGIAASVAEMASTLKNVARQANTIAAGDYSSDIVPRSDKDELGIALRTMTVALRAAREENQARDWLKTGLARLDDALRGDPAINTLADQAITEIATWLEALIGALYVAQDDGRLILLSSYAYVKRKNLSNEFRPGEGLVGQAAREMRPILVRHVPDDYIRITSGLGERVPRCICVTPFSHEGRIKGVLELGTLDDMTEQKLEYLTQAMPVLAVAVEGAEARTKLALALAESQQLAEELQAQQEELRVANEELEEQTQRLQQSEQALRAQQEKLQASNQELEQKNELLGRQKREVERASQDLSAKAEELALASRYKSEFLANMSHELRTPLNSLLLMAQSLAQNKTGNLTEEQVESAQIIYASGSDLLTLINEILDLSKIEAGRMALAPSKVPIADLANGLRASFGHMAQDKGLTLDIVVEASAPTEIETDRKRLEQILRNLLSNALKFTETGSITVRFAPAVLETDSANPGKSGEPALAISVKDTGIGIPAEKQTLIFEAFQQVDGTTTRKYGGTGLGLTISRELASLLGGEIHLESVPGQGSTFTVLLPLRTRPSSAGERQASMESAAPSLPAAGRGPASLAQPFVRDDRDNLTPEDWVILVIEDDPTFASILVAKAHERGFKGLATPNGESGLELVAQYQPRGVILDIRLPGIDGRTVLAGLKNDIRTRHIPVHMISVDDRRIESLRGGAVGHAVKPLNSEELDDVFRKLEEVSGSQSRRVLVVEDDASIRRNTVQLIGNGDVQVDEAETGAAALQALQRAHYDCVVLDLKLPDMSGKEMLEHLKLSGGELPPVVVHTARSLTRDEEEALREYADSIVVKGVRSPERLRDEVALFLHRGPGRMPETQRQAVPEFNDADARLRNRKVLVVDDDMRTTFALSRWLSECGMQPLKAENGERALLMLEENVDIDVVLIDVMMPVMDGYETIRRIRAQERFKQLPIIALTAKAMPQDREKCLDAGASDYIPKPVDTQRLASMMRVWLSG